MMPACASDGTCNFNRVNHNSGDPNNNETELHQRKNVASSLGEALAKLDIATIENVKSDQLAS